MLASAELLETLFDFADPAAAAAWESVGDRVMGGVSSGRMVLVAAGLSAFEGDVSLERGGGFASVRSAPGHFDLSRHEALVLETRGDGKVYKLNLRTDPLFDGVHWQAAFPTQPGRWLAVRLPLDGFRPVWRGRPVPGAAPLDPAAVTSFGLVLGDRQVGPFRLELAALRAVPRGAGRRS